jgi:hypothetical protein
MRPEPSALCGKSFESRHFPVTNARESGRIVTVLGGRWNTYPVGPQYVIERWRTLPDSANTPEGWEFESLRARSHKVGLAALIQIGLRAGNASEALSVTRMSQDLSNSCAQQGLSAGRDNLPERYAGGPQCVVLGVGVDACRDRGIGMSQPLGDDGHRDTPKVQRGAA